MLKGANKVLLTLLITGSFFLNFTQENNNNPTFLNTLDKIIERGEIRVGLESSYVPFEMRNKKGDLIGFDIDYGRKLAKDLGVKFVPIDTNWNEVIQVLLADKCDIIISGMTITQKRNLKVNFAEPYIIVGQTVILHNKYKNRISSYKNLNSPKYIITSSHGTTGEETIQRLLPKAIYKGFHSEIEAIKEVFDGKADAFIYDLPYCAYLQATKGIGKTIFLKEPFTYEPLAWAIKKGDPDFLNFLNNFLKQTKGDGFYDKLYKKWITGSRWRKDIK